MNVLNPENSFKFCGVAGMLLGGPLALWLTLYRGLSPWIEVILGCRRSGYAPGHATCGEDSALVGTVLFSTAT